jgi:serine/threonine protein kinase
MQTRFQYIEDLQRSAQSCLWRALDGQSGEEITVRRYRLDEGEVEAARHLLSTVAGLQHPHMEAVLEIGVDAEGLYAIIEHAKGESLVEMLTVGPLTMREFDQIAEQLLSALSALHEASESHVALRPELLRVRRLPGDILDTCIVGFGEMLPAGDIAAHRCAAPEYWRNKPVGRRTDVYALGCIFYEMLTGHPAFHGATMSELRDAHLRNDFIPLAQFARQAPQWVTSWVTKLLTPDDEKRLKNVTQARDLYQMGEASLPATRPKQDITATVPTRPSVATSHYVIAASPGYLAAPAPGYLAAAPVISPNAE